jgi:hypothetical protein
VSHACPNLCRLSADQSQCDGAAYLPHLRRSIILVVYLCESMLQVEKKKVTLSRLSFVSRYPMDARSYALNKGRPTAFLDPHCTAMSIPQTKDSVQETVEEGPTRYAAFAVRLRTLITASSRCEPALFHLLMQTCKADSLQLIDVAYSSDIGEAFRPLTNPYFVRGAYAVSWTYM